MYACLIQPPRLENAGHVTMSPSPPLGLAYIAGALEAAGHDVTAIDCVGEAPHKYSPFRPFGKPLPEHETLVIRGLNEYDLLERMPEKVDVIGFSCMFAINWVSVKYFINFLRAYYPKALFVAGGEHATAAYAYCLQQSALDVVVLGEGEETIVHLLDAYAQGSPLESVSGIAYKSGNSVRTTPKKERIKSLEEIPRPAWHLFPVKSYQEHRVVWSATIEPSLPMLATRGCPYSCTFCSSPQMWGTRYYMRSPEDVVDEMMELNRKFGITNFDFYDLTAIIKKDWIIRFCQCILENNLKITWQIPAGTRSEAIDREVAAYLHKTGCRNIVYAPETGSIRMLRQIKKKVTITNMLRSIRDSHRENLNVMLNMILGLPGETHKDIWKTCWFLVQTSWYGANTIALSIFLPYPGSALFRQLSEQGVINPEHDDYYLNMVYIDTNNRMPWYNKKINHKWYIFYLVLYYIFFYGSNFLFRPHRLIKVLWNVATQRFESRFEVNLRHYLELKASQAKNLAKMISASIKPPQSRRAA
ncbi:MAG: B12-binding domain-containing radical SAM protein [Chitinophagales bacterium]|nr:MAG: B12-binding domain-containing radical SAM protein [Chitinophagales bacterium]